MKTKVLEFMNGWLAPSTTSVQAVEPLPRGFKQAKWGMTKAELKSVYPDLFHYGDSGDVYKLGYIKDNYPIDEMTYYFYDNKLYKIVMSYNRFDIKYDEIVAEMIKKYGQPKKKGKEEFDKLSRAIFRNIFFRTWEDENTRIRVKYLIPRRNVNIKENISTYFASIDLEKQKYAEEKQK